MSIEGPPPPACCIPDIDYWDWKHPEHTRLTYPAILPHQDQATADSLKEFPGHNKYLFDGPSKSCLVCFAQINEHFLVLRSVSLPQQNAGVVKIS